MSINTCYSLCLKYSSFESPVPMKMTIKKMIVCFPSNSYFHIFKNHFSSLSLGSFLKCLNLLFKSLYDLPTALRISNFCTAPVSSRLGFPLFLVQGVFFSTLPSPDSIQPALLPALHSFKCFFFLEEKPQVHAHLLFYCFLLVQGNCFLFRVSRSYAQSYSYYKAL